MLIAAQIQDLACSAAQAQAAIVGPLGEGEHPAQLATVAQVEVQNVGPGATGPLRHELQVDELIGGQCLRRCDLGTAQQAGAFAVQRQRVAGKRGNQGTDPARQEQHDGDEQRRRKARYRVPSALRADAREGAPRPGEGEDGTRSVDSVGSLGIVTLLLHSVARAASTDHGRPLGDV